MAENVCMDAGTVCMDVGTVCMDVVCVGDKGADVELSVKNHGEFLSTHRKAGQLDVLYFPQ